MKLVTFLIFSAFIMLSFNVFAIHDTKKIEYLIKAANKYIGFNGTVLIANSNEIIYQKSFGYADKDMKINLTGKHQLSTGSISKEFTTVAILMLQEQGKLNLSDKVSKYLPNYPSWTSEITIEQLLAHTSGLPQIKWRDGLNTEDVMGQMMAIKALSFKPGSSWLYGNLNVLLRAIIIEKISEVSFADFMKENLFTPSGMSNTFNKIDLTDRRSSLVISEKHSAILGVSFFSTTFDLYQWQQALWANKLISKNARQKALSIHQEAIKKENGKYKRAYFDLGHLRFNNDNKLMQVVHAGSNPEHHAIMGKDLDKDFIMILMSSDGRKSTLFEINDYLSNLSSYSESQIPDSWWLTYEMKESGFDAALVEFIKKIERGGRVN